MIGILISFVALAVVGFGAFLLWPKIRGWFSDSETLFFARVQIAVGGLLSALALADWTPIFHALGWSKWVPVYILMSGVLTEVLRKLRDPELH